MSFHGHPLYNNFFREFCNILLDLPKGTQLEHFIMSKMGEQISPTAHKALNRGVHPYAQA